MSMIQKAKYKEKNESLAKTIVTKYGDYKGFNKVLEKELEGLPFTFSDEGSADFNRYAANIKNLEHYFNGLCSIVELHHSGFSGATDKCYRECDVPTFFPRVSIVQFYSMHSGSFCIGYIDDKLVITRGFNARPMTYTKKCIDDLIKAIKVIFSTEGRDKFYWKKVASILNKRGDGRGIQAYSIDDEEIIYWDWGWSWDHINVPKEYKDHPMSIIEKVESSSANDSMLLPDLYKVSKNTVNKTFKKAAISKIWTDEEIKGYQRFELEADWCNRNWIKNYEKAGVPITKEMIMKARNA